MPLGRATTQGADSWAANSSTAIMTSRVGEAAWLEGEVECLVEPTRPMGVLAASTALPTGEVGADELPRPIMRFMRPRLSSRCANRCSKSWDACLAALGSRIPTCCLKAPRSVRTACRATPHMDTMRDSTSAMLARPESRSAHAESCKV